MLRHLRLPGTVKRACFLQQVRGFATEKELRDRISVIKNISKVTKAMNMVAAAAMKKHQNALEKARSFAAGIDGLLFASEKENSSIIVVPFSSDKGLCGGVNTMVNRETRRDIQHFEHESREVKLFTYGLKSRANLSRTFSNIMQGAILENSPGAPVTFSATCEVAHILGGLDASNLHIIYNDFVNVISYDTKRVTVATKKEFAEAAEKKFEAYEEEGDEGGTFENFYEFLLAVNVHKVINNCQTCEQSSRMTAMDNSSSNADEMYDKLLLQANRARQAKITKELMEITSGAAAVE